MKKIFSLPATLRVIFGVGRILMGFSGCVILLVWLVRITNPHAEKFLHFPTPFESGPLAIGANSIRIKSNVSAAEDIQIHSLTSELFVNWRTTDPELAAAIRWTLLPRLVVSFTAWWMILGLLRQLCVRIEGGEVFSELNLRSIRNLGTLLLISSTIEGVLIFCTAHRLGGYLAQHSTFVGINATFDASVPRFSQLPYGTLITGLLVAETFRQGLALQKENELTV